MAQISTKMRRKHTGSQIIIGVDIFWFKYKNVRLITPQNMKLFKVNLLPINIKMNCKKNY